MSATREVEREKARVARDLIKSHTLMPELSAELFAQKGIGAFRFSAALIEWSQSELEGLQKVWVRGQSVRYRSWWKQGNIKMAVSDDYASCWVYKDLIVTTKQFQALLTAARASGRKDDCQVRLTGIERKYWMGTEISRLGGYSFRGTVTAGDGSNQKGGFMGAGYVNLRKQRKRQQRKGGREEEGSSPNRPELAAFVLALRGTPVTSSMLTSSMLYWCDNQALLKSVKRWVGEGGKATLVGAPDADILLEAIEELRKEQQQEQRRFWSR